RVDSLRTGYSVPSTQYRIRPLTTHLNAAAPYTTAQYAKTTVSPLYPNRNNQFPKYGFASKTKNCTPSRAIQNSATKPQTLRARSDPDASSLGKATEIAPKPIITSTI